MPTPEQVRSAVDSYLAAFEASDRDAFVALWAEGATHRDPADGDARVGREAIGAFWDGVVSMADSFAVDLHQVNVCGPYAAVFFTMNTISGDTSGDTTPAKTASGTAAQGATTVSIDIIDVFTVDDDGKIASMSAYWDPAHIRVS